MGLEVCRYREGDGCLVGTDEHFSDGLGVGQHSRLLPEEGGRVERLVSAPRSASDGGISLGPPLAGGEGGERDRVAEEVHRTRRLVGSIHSREIAGS